MSKRDGETLISWKSIF